SPREFCIRGDVPPRVDVHLFPGGVHLRARRRSCRAQIDVSRSPVRVAGDDRRAGGLAHALWLGVHDDPVAVDESVCALAVGILAPQIPLAYVAARFAVARARRGDVPDWRGAFASLAEIAHVSSRRRGDFTSPPSAQAWFEWRRYGGSLPAWVAILLPFELL